MATIFSDANFEVEVLNSEVPVLVDCWASWCGPCNAIAPLIDKLASEYEGAKIGKLNVDENKATTAQFPVNAIPTLLFFKGGKVVDRIVGVAQEAAIIAKLDALKG